ncbi:MAG: WD40 repeat domain-containing protein, partial [Bacteroidota bacterium]
MKYAIQFILFYYLIFSFNIYAQEEYIIEKYKKHEGYVYDVSFSPDQEKFISSSDDKTAIIWSLESKSPLYTLEKHYAEVRCAKFRHDGKYVVTGGDKSLVIWKNTGEYINTLTGHHTYIWTLDISKDNKYIVSGSFDNKFYLWDFNAVENLHVFEGHEKSVLVVCFSPNGKYIASGSLDKTIKIWNTETGENIITFPGHAD